VPFVKRSKSDIAEQPSVHLHGYIVEPKYGIHSNIAIGAPKVGGDEVPVDRQMVPTADLDFLGEERWAQP
jgi:hypothetical protein